MRQEWARFAPPSRGDPVLRPDQIAADLRDLIRKVRTEAGPSFSGLGLLVSDHPDRLPLAPLREGALPSGPDLAAVLAAVSRNENEAHDGFHVISSDFRLLRLSQLFSPPIPRNATPDRDRPFGARYMAARLGSLLPDVLMIGVASRNIGLAIFRDGEELMFELPA